MYIKTLKISVLVSYNLAFGVALLGGGHTSRFGGKTIRVQRYKKKMICARKARFFYFLLSFLVYFKFLYYLCSAKYVAYEKIYDFDGPDDR